MEQIYPLKVAGITRDLPIITVAPGIAIPRFVILGDCEVVVKSAPLLVDKLPEVDILVTAEVKGIPLVHEIARLLGHTRYIVVRKTRMPYMDDPLIDEVAPIATQKRQTLILDGNDALDMKGRRVGIIDDVIKTGESIQAVERLIERAGGTVTAKAAILAEGDAANRPGILFLEKLPVFIGETYN